MCLYIHIDKMQIINQLSLMLFLEAMAGAGACGIPWTLDLPHLPLPHLPHSPPWALPTPYSQSPQVATPQQIIPLLVSDGPRP